MTENKSTGINEGFLVSEKLYQVVQNRDRLVL